MHLLMRVKLNGAGLSSAENPDHLLQTQEGNSASCKLGGAERKTPTKQLFPYNNSNLSSLHSAGDGFSQKPTTGQKFSVLY